MISIFTSKQKRLSLQDWVAMELSIYLMIKDPLKPWDQINIIQDTLQKIMERMPIRPILSYQMVLDYENRPIHQNRLLKDDGTELISVVFNELRSDYRESTSKIRLDSSGSRCIYIDIMDNQSIESIHAALFDLQMQGFTPVVVHPERTSYIYNNLYNAQRLKERGVMFQSDFIALTGYYGRQVKRTANYLLENNLYDFFSASIYQEEQLDALEGIKLRFTTIELIEQTAIKIRKRLLALKV